MTSWKRSPHPFRGLAHFAVVRRSAPTERASTTAEPAHYVLKRSWDYGGRAVFVGKSSHEASFDDRVVASYGKKMSWPELCRVAAADPVGGGFVVQGLVDAKPEPHLLCTQNGEQEAMLYVDFSAYASVNLSIAPQWGAVCRGSISPIVNIVGGGGVLPLISPEVARAFVDAMRARP
jgi:hypothetical protein